MDGWFIVEDGFDVEFGSFLVRCFWESEFGSES